MLQLFQNGRLPTGQVLTRLRACSHPLTRQMTTSSLLPPPVSC